MEHLADELHSRWLVGILLLEMHDEPKSPILEWGIGGPDYDGIPKKHISGCTAQKLIY
jgi:hypothetical protein